MNNNNLVLIIKTSYLILSYGVNYELDQLRAFIAVVENRKFSLCGGCNTQNSAGHQCRVKHWEAQYGIFLF